MLFSVQLTHQFALRHLVIMFFFFTLFEGGRTSVGPCGNEHRSLKILVSCHCFLHLDAAETLCVQKADGPQSASAVLYQLGATSDQSGQCPKLTCENARECIENV